MPFPHHMAVIVVQIVLHLTMHDMHDAMLLPQLAVHFHAIALCGPASVVVGDILPLVQQKMYDLDIAPIIVQQKTCHH